MSFESEQALTIEMAPGERLLWSGRPRGGLRLRPADALMIPFGLVWGGFAVFWEVGVVRSGAPAFFALWGVPFIAMGAYVTVGRFIFDARLRAHTFYGLTDRRVLIVSGTRRRQVTSLQLQSLGDVTLQEGRERRGTILFGSGPLGPGGRPVPGAAWMAGTSMPGARRYAPPSFEMLENVRDVYSRVTAAQQATLARPAGS